MNWRLLYICFNRHLFISLAIYLASNPFFSSEWAILNPHCFKISLLCFIICICGAIQGSLYKSSIGSLVWSDFYKCIERATFVFLEVPSPITKISFSLFWKYLLCPSLILLRFSFDTSIICGWKIFCIQ